jgi:hypothetical protein
VLGTIPPLGGGGAVAPPLPLLVALLLVGGTAGLARQGQLWPIQAGAERHVLSLAARPAPCLVPAPQVRGGEEHQTPCDQVEAFD